MMQYGWLSNTTPTDFHSQGDQFLALLANRTIKIPATGTFYFRGFKSSLISFLRQYPLYAFESVSDHLFIKGGEEMENGWKEVVAAVGKGIAAPAMAANEFVEIAHGALEGALEVVGVDSSVKPSKIGAFLDRQMNQRLMIMLNSYGAPRVGTEKAFKVEQRLRFIDLVVLIGEHF